MEIIFGIPGGVRKTEPSLQCLEELSPTGQPNKEALKRQKHCLKKPHFPFPPLLLVCSPVSEVCLFNYQWHLPGVLIAQHRSCRDIAQRWDHRTSPRAGMRPSHINHRGFRPWVWRSNKNRGGKPRWGMGIAVGCVRHPWAGWSPQAEMMPPSRAHCAFGAAWSVHQQPEWGNGPDSTPKTPRRSWAVLPSSSTPYRGVLPQQCPSWNTREARGESNTELKGKDLTTDMNHDMSQPFSLTQLQNSWDKWHPGPRRADPALRWRLEPPWHPLLSNLCPCYECFKNKIILSNQNAEINYY